MNRIKTHPGAILRGEIEELGLGANQLAAALAVPASRVRRITKEQQAINPDMAIRLAAYFGGAARWWLAMQAAHDLSKLELERGDAIRATVRRPAHG